MESHHSLSSGDSSPRSREINCESNNNSSSWDEPPPAATAAKVKLMCSYGGRIQPRHHDNKLSYVGGETKILAVDRFIRFPSFKALLPSSTSNDVCIKYQLPGEDLDSLISVTNDEDLEHMMLEYDRLLRPSAASARPAPRLRLFLFPISNKQPDRHWFVEPLNSVPLPDPLTSPPPPGSDFLFGLDKDFVPPPAVKVKDPAPEMEPPLSVEVPAKEDRTFGGGDSAAAVSPAEIQRQIQELQRMQIAAENQEIQRMQIAAAENQEIQRMQIAAAGNQEMQRMQIAAAGNQELQRMQVAAENQERMQIASENNQHQQQAVSGFQRNSSDDALASRVLTTGGDYYMPRAPENTAAQIPAGYWAEQRMAAAPAPSRYASVVGGGGGGEHPLYMIPGPYPGGAAYYAAVPRMMPPAEAYRDGAAAMYAMGHQPPPTPSANLTGGPLGATQQQQQGGEGYTVAYDSAGRAVYYTGSVIPGAYHHQTVTSSVNPVGVVDGSKIANKTPQVS